MQSCICWLSSFKCYNSVQTLLLPGYYTRIPSFTIAPFNCGYTIFLKRQYLSCLRYKLNKPGVKIINQSLNQKTEVFALYLHLIVLFQLKEVGVKSQEKYSDVKYKQTYKHNMSSQNQTGRICLMSWTTLNLNDTRQMVFTIFLKVHIRQ